MTATYAVGLIATVCGPEGPTLQHREVLEVAVCDFGGNIHGRAKTPHGVERIRRRMRVPTYLKPTKLGKLVPAEAFQWGYTVDCGWC